MSAKDIKKLALSSKDELRAFCISKRKAFLAESPEKKAELDLEIQSRFLMSREYRDAEIVLTYVSRDFEISTRALIAAAFSNKKKVAVPRVEEDGEMRFYLILSFDDLKVGAFGILEPKKGCKAVDDQDSSVCVTPALCCDMNGYRLGFGRGYYDRYFADFRGAAVAFCYSDELLVKMQHDEFDQSVSTIVTDAFLRRI